MVQFLCLGKHRHSHRSQSASRSSSRKNSIEKNNGFTVSSSLNNESFVDKLTQTLLHKQHQQQQQHNVAVTMNEIAKAAASSALQRKQSVPELNSVEQYNPSFKNQNRVTFSSSLNLSTSGNSGGNNNNQAFQVVEIQTNSTQQPIYASRTQMQREIHNLYGTLGQQHSEIYNDNNSGNGHQRSSSYYHQQNGFFNKVSILLIMKLNRFFYLDLFSNSYNIHQKKKSANLGIYPFYRYTQMISYRKKNLPNYHNQICIYISEKI